MSSSENIARTHLDGCGVCSKAKKASTKRLHNMVGCHKVCTDKYKQVIGARVAKALSALTAAGVMRWEATENGACACLDVSVWQSPVTDKVKMHLANNYEQTGKPHSHFILTNEEGYELIHEINPRLP